MSYYLCRFPEPDGSITRVFLPGCRNRLFIMSGPHPKARGGPMALHGKKVWAEFSLANILQRIVDAANVSQLDHCWKLGGVSVH